MDGRRQSRAIIRFGVFEANVAARELRKSGIRLKLQAQPFQVLVTLLERPGDVVSREELQHQLWPDETFVDFDQSLNTAVRKIRQALDDSAENPRYIETLPRIGYRFVYPVDGASTAPPRNLDVQPLAGAAVPRPPPASPLIKGGRAGLFAGVAALTVAVLGAALYFWPGGDFADTPSDAALLPVPLTSYRGTEQHPSFSPDGNHVAFSWDGEEQGNTDIYIKLIGSVSSQRLTTHPHPDLSPVYSPDGRYIAFIRRPADGLSAVVLIPAIGGPERVLTEGDFATRYSGRELAWFPDSIWLVVSCRSEPGRPTALFRLSTETGELRRLISPPDGSSGDGAPAVSPDGRTLAFFRDASWSDRDVHLLSMSEDHQPIGEPQRRTFLNGWIDSIAWTPDGREIVFNSGAHLRGGLWRIQVHGAGEPQRLAFAGEEAFQVAISRHERRLAYTKKVQDRNIWRLELPGPENESQIAAVPPVPFIVSTRTELGPAYSPNGKRIAYSSNVSGDPTILVCDADGSNPVKLFSQTGASCGSVHWSPDGRRLAFDSNMHGQSDIFLIAAKGGRPTRFTTHAALDAHPSWSNDGKWVYFNSRRSGEYQIWKKPVGKDGPAGEPVQLTTNRGAWAFESPDGSLYYQTPKDGGAEVALASLWRIPADGGDAAELVPTVVRRNFAVTRRGVYFMVLPDEPDGSQLIQFLDSQSGEIRTLASISGSRVNTGMSVSPDGRSLLYVQRDVSGSDLMLVENFR